MHRFYISNPRVTRDRLRLDGEEWHHCRTVLRAKEGGRVTVFDGAGHSIGNQVELGLVEIEMRQ